MKKYIGRITYKNKPKNRLEEAVHSCVELFDRHIMSKKLQAFNQDRILKEISILNEKFPRCTPIQPAFTCLPISVNKHLDWVFEGCATIGFKFEGYEDSESDVEENS